MTVMADAKIEKSNWQKANKKENGLSIVKVECCVVKYQL